MNEILTKWVDALDWHQRATLLEVRDRMEEAGTDRASVEGIPADYLSGLFALELLRLDDGGLYFTALGAQIADRVTV